MTCADCLKEVKFLNLVIQEQEIENTTASITTRKATKVKKWVCWNCWKKYEEEKRYFKEFYIYEVKKK